VVTTLSMTILPALATIRDQSQNELSKANLMEMGKSRDQYAMENKDRIFTYTWRAGETYTMPYGPVITPRTDLEAAKLQNTEILQRRTGRLTGIQKIQSGYGRVPHRRLSHLILLDAVATSDAAFLGSQMGIDPADENLLTWHERPLEYGIGSGLPYASGGLGGYDDDLNWPTNPVRQRWPFVSSYQVVPHAWQGDGNEYVYAPVEESPHLFIAANGDAILGRRHMSEVAFPAQKVHMHEEFDFEQSRYPYFAYDHARPEKLMFDGSINSQPSGEANDSVSPEDFDQYHPDDPSGFIPIWTQRYVPLDTFPIPMGGFDDDTLLNMRYRWTLFGLQGVDYD